MVVRDHLINDFLNRKGESFVDQRLLFRIHEEEQITDSKFEIKPKMDNKGQRQLEI